MLTRFVALATLAASAQALSTGCTTELAALALGSLGSCLQLTSLLPVLSDSGSIVSDLNTYLTSLCSSSTPTCSNSTLSSAASSLNSSCSSDISGGGTNAAEVEGLLTIIEFYPEVYAAACSKNSTTGDYCVTDTLNTVQTDTNTNITISSLSSLLAGDQSSISSLETAFATGNLCTGCVQGIYYEVVKANATVANTTIASALSSQCGASFLQASPSTIATTSGAAASSSAASASASKSSGTRVAWSVAPFAVAAVAVAGSLVGAAAVTL